MNSHTYGHLIFDKGAKNIQWEKKTAFSTNGACLTGSQHAEEWKSIHSYLQYKAQVQVDQRPSHKIQYTETNKRQSGKEPQLLLELQAGMTTLEIRLESPQKIGHSTS